MGVVLVSLPDQDHRATASPDRPALIASRPIIPSNFQMYIRVPYRSMAENDDLDHIAPGLSASTGLRVEVPGENPIRPIGCHQRNIF